MSDQLGTELTELLQRQWELQAYLKTDPFIMTEDLRIRYIRDMILALENELHAEVLQEVGWKPWATKRFINTDAYLGELIDVFHFWMNLVLASGLTPQTLGPKLAAMYEEKRQRNFVRHANGDYDGVTGKCWSCRRDLGDTGTTRIHHEGEDDAVACASCGASLFLVPEA